jgi:hypothetical protein
MSKVKVISYGKLRGQNTVQVVIVTDQGRHQTRHLRQINKDRFMDNNANGYDVKSPK